MTVREQHRSGSRLTLLIWLLYWGALFVATHLPRLPNVTLGVKHGDKLLHFLAYFLLMMFCGRHLRSAGRRPSGSILLRWLCLFLAYGAIDEWLQGFVNREPSVLDWVANGAGLLLAALIVFQAPQREGISEAADDGA